MIDFYGAGKAQVRRVHCPADNRERTMRQVIIYPGEDQYYVAECPSLPGCISQGGTREEAISNIREAIEGYISALEQDHIPVPPEKFEALLVAV
jgi:predicted RNase H-like HicB family nuclease